ncbi:hypothetical protein BO86DRAFT_395621 [Aspergillus japonicus CBS 114.51]|uniref:Uncharacterized protein n=1 Tax=Aspergillus japonicus CBS 114.51 TaxID=1448312 RepID=A0A8T8XED0_ASPJA|nr:hypothetical protein BO86DRAFT_395621 [Aspergillus japonicus CBS 114.51]RAH86174.1 hypothetical protein BO86DRAFT_395621 [Aspergillus japonicus CBS 114.51]
MSGLGGTETCPVADKTTVPVLLLWCWNTFLERGSMRPDEAWETLDSSQTRSIARQLDSYLHQLRHLQGITFDIWITAKPSSGCERQFTAFILDDLVKLPDLLRHFQGML